MLTTAMDISSLLSCIESSFTSVKLVLSDVNRKLESGNRKPRKVNGQPFSQLWV